MSKKLTPKKFNKIIDEAIAHLAKEEFNKAAEAIEEIAHLMKSAGLNKHGFADMVAHIGSQAARFHPDPIFLDEKLKIALRDRAEKRGTILRIVK